MRTRYLVVGLAFAMGIATGVIFGQVKEQISSQRIIAGTVPVAGEYLFDIEPFFEGLSQLSIFQEEQSLFAVVTRMTSGDRYRIHVSTSESSNTDCIVSRSEVKTISSILHIGIDRFVGFQIDDNGKGLPREMLDTYGFGSTEASLSSGSISYKSVGFDVESIALGRAVVGEQGKYYVIQKGGAISIVNLMPLIEMIQGLCERSVRSD